MGKPTSSIGLADKGRYELLQRFLFDEHVLVHLNPKHPGVVLPTQFSQQEILTLKLSKLFRGAMELTQEKVQAELLFDQNYFTCIVPLEAVWGATSIQGKTFIWPENAPKSLLDEVNDEQPRHTETTTATTPRKKGHLTRVK